MPSPLLDPGGILAAEPLPDIWTGDGFTTTVVVWLGITVLALLVTTALLTLVKSYREYRRDRKRMAIEDRRRPQIQARAMQEPPRWSSWVADLGAEEQPVVEEILLDEVAVLEGRSRDRLEALSRELEMDTKAQKSANSADHYRRLRGLKRLAALNVSLDPTDLEGVDTTRRSEREALVHVLAVSPGESTKRYGIELLLQGDPMTVYGLDGLHALIETDPGPLLEYLSGTHVASAQLLSQALYVLRKTGVPAETVPVDGVIDAVTQDDPVIRQRACQVLNQYGWHPTVRDRVDIEPLLSDPELSVRLAVYDMLDSWGDEEALRYLSKAVDGEDEEYARVRLARALTRKRPQSVEQIKAEGGLDAPHRHWAEIKQLVGNRPDPLS